MSAAAQVPDNDRCIAREILQPYVPVSGNNTEANYDYYNQGVCGPRSDRPALWYEVRGRGAEVTVHVCTNNDIITDFGIFLECNTQKCLGAPAQTFEPADCALGESVSYSFLAERDIQYFVHVRSDVIDGMGSNFTIVYEDSSLDGPIDEPDPSDPSGPNNPDDAQGSGQQALGMSLAMFAAAFSMTALFL